MRKQPPRGCGTFTKCQVNQFVFGFRVWDLGLNRNGYDSHAVKKLVRVFSINRNGNDSYASLNPEP